MVHILLSTHNGAAFLHEQLDSLLNQDYPGIRIFIRDDGSVDDTPRILREYQDKHARIRVVFGKHAGVNWSFYKLLEMAPANHGLYAFCDQDDVWDSDKVRNAVEKLAHHGDPASALYLSRYRFVDENLREIRISRNRKHLGFSNAVVESGVAGCTMVFGARLRDIMLWSNPDDWHMHDWWMYLVAAAFGEVVFDPDSRMKYRRHTTNTTAWEKWGMTRALSRTGLFLHRNREGKKGMVSLQQAGRFIRQYDQIIAPDLSQIVLELEDLRSGGKVLQRLRYVTRPRVRRESFLENLALLLVIALGQH